MSPPSFPSTVHFHLSSLHEPAQTFVLSILKRQDGACSLSLSSTVSLSHNLLSHNHTLSLSFSFWLALFIALLVLFIASRTGHTRGNSSSSVSNLPRLSNRTLEGGYPRATCGEAHQVSSRRQRPKPPFPPHSECNSICLFFLCTAEAYRISCIT